MGVILPMSDPTLSTETPGDRVALGVAGELHIERRSETPTRFRGRRLGHLHDPGFGVGGRGARLLLRFLPGLGRRARLLCRGSAFGFFARAVLLLGLQVFGYRQSVTDPT